MRFLVAKRGSCTVPLHRVCNRLLLYSAVQRAVSSVQSSFVQKPLHSENKLIHINITEPPVNFWTSIFEPKVSYNTGCRIIQVFYMTGQIPLWNVTHITPKLWCAYMHTMYVTNPCNLTIFIVKIQFHMYVLAYLFTCDISRQGSFPFCAPVKPYTELALIFSASCRPSNTFCLNGSVSFFRSALALAK